MHRLDPIALQRAKIVGVSKLVSQLLEDLPVAVASGSTIFLLEVLPQMILHTIVVEQGIVDVEQEHDLGHLAHTCSLLGRCHVGGNPSPSRQAAFMLSCSCRAALSRLR